MASTPQNRSLADTQADLLLRVKTEGVLAAYEASLAICRDPKAPAPARATASATLFRVAGYFDRREGSGVSKEPSEMTPEELAEAIAQIERRAQQKPPSLFD